MSACSSCLTSKAPLQCVFCQGALCKDCAQFVDENSYPFHPLFEKKLNLGTQCPNCFDQHTKSQVDEYNEIYEKAKNIDVYFRRTDGKEARLMERIEPALKVENCLDENDVLLRLAFCAVQKEATAVVDIEVRSQKFKDGSYTTVVWNGTGFAANR